MKSELSEIACHLAEIRRAVTAMQDHSTHRMAFESGQDGALSTGVFLRQSYPVEVVARIAASCPGDDHKARIMDALRLLEAAEDVANPNPWEDQHLIRQDGDGLGDIPNMATEKAIGNREAKIPAIISDATDKSGKIRRAKLVEAACLAAGKALSQARRDDLFREWLAIAAESFGRWQSFKQMNLKDLGPDPRVLEARKALASAQDEHNALEKEPTEDRDEKYDLLRASRDRIWKAERNITRCLNQAAEDAVSGLRDRMSKDEIVSEREEFKTRLEHGSGRNPRIIHDEGTARSLLQGTSEFGGLLAFLVNPPPKEENTPVVPPAKDEHGKMMERPKRADGTYKSHTDNSGLGEVADGLPITPHVRTATTSWRSKTQKN